MFSFSQRMCKKFSVYAEHKVRREEKAHCRTPHADLIGALSSSFDALNYCRLYRLYTAFLLGSDREKEKCPCHDGGSACFGLHPFNNQTRTTATKCYNATMSLSTWAAAAELLHSPRGRYEWATYLGARMSSLQADESRAQTPSSSVKDRKTRNNNSVCMTIRKS